MSGRKWLIRNELQLEHFIGDVTDLFKKHKRLLFEFPEVGGEDRSMDQNALFHVWIKQYAAHLLKKSPQLVATGEMEGMKRHAKIMFYKDTRNEWMLNKIVNPKTGESKNDVRSTKGLSKAQMFEFMEWLQAMAATDGLILESKGEYQRILEEHLS